MNKNKYLVYGALIVVLAIVLVVLAVHNKKTAQAPGGSKTSNQPQIPLPPVPQLTATQADQGQLPANFPAKLPIESNPTVLQNETVLNSITNKHNASYIYATKLTIAQNLTAYKKFLTTNKWGIASTVDQPSFQAINATSTAGSLSIILDYKSAAPQNKVSLNFVY